MISLEIVVFANSYKNSFHCVAGKTTANKKWIRPVSNKMGGELNHKQIEYKNPYGTYPVKTLQRIKMDLLENVPLLNQPENYLISDRTWVQNYSISEEEIWNYIDKPKNLWGEGDRVNFKDLMSKKLIISQSLYLIEVENLELYVSEYKKRRACFEYNKISYDLAVTDPNFEKIMNDTKELESILCISLGSNYQGSCFKLVAGIF